MSVFRPDSQIDLPVSNDRAASWSFADQGVVSLGNFLTNIVLARSLPPREFGSYAILFAILLVLYGAHGALVTYPLSVRGASGSVENLQELLNLSLWLTTAGAVGAGVILTIACWSYGRPVLGVCVAGALLFWLLQETTRRALMARLRHRDAVWGDAISYLGQALAISVLAATASLSIEKAFAVMAGTSIVATALQIAQVGIRSIVVPEFHEAIRMFWGLGRWLFVNNFVAIFSVQLFPWMLGLLWGAGQVGQLQALLNLVGVTNPISIGTANLIVPATTRAWHSFGKKAAYEVAMLHGVRGAMFVVPYLLIALLWPQHLLTALYGHGSPYISLQTALRVLAVGQCLFYCATVISSLLNALEESRTNFLALSVSAVASIVVGVPLVLRDGLWGAVVTIVLGISIRSAIVYFAARRQVADRSGRQPQYQENT